MSDPGAREVPVWCKPQPKLAG
ncbi:unnamed protein product [Linum tenue]|uniref:Uncharacterized protein n=1 Tax=Linum tenue TaxID=586396 RepID=A0AAV0JGW1_9ROSI|nr:unnamed protein product [Linum tenue]